MQMLVVINTGTEIRNANSDDNILDEAKVKLSRTLLEDIIAKHGMPDVCYHSPYSGPTATAELLKSVTNTRIPIIPDPEIGKLMPRQPTLQRDAKIFYPVIDTNEQEFEDRIRHRLKRLLSYASSHKVWIITHPCCMKIIASAANMNKFPKIFPSNTFIVLNDRTARTDNNIRTHVTELTSSVRQPPTIQKAKRNFVNSYHEDDSSRSTTLDPYTNRYQTPNHIPQQVGYTYAPQYRPPENEFVNRTYSLTGTKKKSKRVPVRDEDYSVSMTAEPRYVHLNLGDI